MSAHPDREELESRTGRPSSLTNPSLLLSSSTPSLLDQGELPFLVTNWLANYSAEGKNPEIINRVHRAAAELASAFSEVGVFGPAVQPSLDASCRHYRHAARQTFRNATFADMRRRWASSCPPDRLDHLLQASAATNRASDSVCVKPSNLLALGAELRTDQIRNPKTGRTVEDAIDVETRSNGVDCVKGQQFQNEQPHSTVLQPPVFLETSASKTEMTVTAGPQYTSTFELHALSNVEVKAKHASNLARSFIDLRSQCLSREDHLRKLNQSLSHQNELIVRLQKQHDEGKRLLTDGGLAGDGPFASQLQQEEEIQNCNRVIAQLSRQVSITEDQLEKDKIELTRVEKEARAAHVALLDATGKYRDPFGVARSGAGIPTNRVFHIVNSRQLGLGGLPSLGIAQHRASRGLLGPALSTADMRKKLLHSELSHGATINTHLNHPVYCVRFDRTGRYFVTGADDGLSRLFCLGSFAQTRKGSGFDQASYIRGAILVCTFHGHAGVITDINVSSDNAFLATASEDGDVRVWGLKDGTPIAILRGHAGGANTFSWSDLTPYQLITTANDGYARVWDIKEACLRRYKSVIGKRPDYAVAKSKDGSSNDRSKNDEQQSQRVDTDSTAAHPKASPDEGETLLLPGSDWVDAIGHEVPLPPLPPPAVNIVQLGPVLLPPLPPGENSGQAVAVPPLPPAAAGGENAPGPFVPGDAIDRGVTLLAKLQHGATRDENTTGVSTRLRRKAVKVLCVAFCPTGGHFTTGAADGMCRVFSTVRDRDMELADCKACEQITAMSLLHTSRRQQSGRSHPPRLLLTLKGHLSSITDLQYSYAGDRLLSASQRDGVVRIWSWSADPAKAIPTSSAETGSPAGLSKSCQVSHIVIKLTNPKSSQDERRQQGQSSRRRPVRVASANVSCDVAAWVRDDKAVVTSQCEVSKQSSGEIVPGSHYIFLWDSRTGQCLLGINGAHTMQAMVLLPHPTDPSIVCSAGGDGMAHVWDLETGKCIMSHKNAVDFGPVNDERDRGKISGYLDASFSPDGVNLVLTDDHGRVTLLNCVQKERAEPIWMREQYFANDYYDLLYDPDGYCIEQGSEQPPHLAPRGARCFHDSTPYGDDVNKAFKLLPGPAPVPQQELRWDRISRRLRGASWYEKRLHRGNIVGQYDPSTTTIVSAFGESIAVVPPTTDREGGFVSPQPEPARAAPRLSSNWRWRDYEDVLMEERNNNNNDEEQMDSDDDSFQLENNTRRNNSRRRGGASLRRSEPSARAENVDEDDSEPETGLEVVLDDSPAPAPRGRRNAKRMDQWSDDEEELLQVGSTNNTPSGPFIADYDIHYFKMKEDNYANNAWFLRVESNSSYDGTKSYAPQVGDSVVYIPRAHHETLIKFPSLVPPWQSWPDAADWPVVRCSIRNIRYRFPYKTYFPRKNSGQAVIRSVVAILTLELTGVPDQSNDDSFSAEPSFTSPGDAHMFEVALFESNVTDFIIPLSLYTSRLTSLARALGEQENPLVEAMYANEEEEEDGHLDPFPGNVIAVEQEKGLEAPNLRGSGYESILVEWVEDQTTSLTSPWELRIPGWSPRQAERPHLTDGEKKRVRDALGEILEMEGVREYFSKEVNTVRYYDYLSRVEVPMYLDLVKTRLESNYYSNRLSVIADMKLIRENSFKYNGEHDDLTKLATEMLDKFTGLVLSSEEYLEYQRFQSQLEKEKLDEAPEIRGDDTAQYQPIDFPIVQKLPARADGGGGLRRSNRATRNTSALESLPPPAGRNHVQRVRLRMSQNVESQNRSRSASTRTSRSVLEPEAFSAPVVGVDAGTRRRISRNTARGEQPSARQLRSNSHADQTTSGASIRRSALMQASHVLTQQPTARQRRTSSGTLTQSSESTQRRSSRRRGRSQPEIENSVFEADESVSNNDGPSRSKDEEINVPQDPPVGAHSQRIASPRSTRSQLEKIVDSGSEHGGVEDQRRRNRRSTRSQLEKIAGSSAEHGVEDYAAMQSEEYRPANRRTSATSGGGSDVSYQNQESGDSEGLDQEMGSEEELDKGQNDRRKARRAGRRSNCRSPGKQRKTRAARASGRQHPQDSDSSVEELAKRTRSKRPMRNFDEKKIVDSADDGEDDSDAESDRKPPASRRNTRRSSVSVSSPARSGGRMQQQQRRKQRKNSPQSQEPDSPRRSCTMEKSYQDPDSSEFGSDFEVEEYAPAAKAANGKRKKSSRRVASKKPVKKRKTKGEDVDNCEELPVTKKWPEVKLKEITLLAHAILQKLRLRDSHAAFSRPVEELYPEVADDYNSRIEKPMDFRSIEEEYLPQYRNIHQLQDDLKLVFTNCITYNKNGSALASLARELLASLDEIFREACRELKVQISRRW